MSENHLLYTFGLPEVIVTDNGPSFVSEEFETFLRNNAWYPTQEDTTLSSILQRIG